MSANFICSFCGKSLKSNDLKKAEKREEHAKMLYGRLPKVSSRLIEIWNVQRVTNYCGLCISVSYKWENDKRHCVDCVSFSINFVHLKNIPDFYCHRLNNKSIGEPSKDSCEYWKLRE
jgi:hypothetical protein